MGRRQRIPSLASAVLWACAPAVIVLAFFALGDPQLQATVRSLYSRSAETLPSIWPSGLPMHPIARRMWRPEKFVIVPAESTVAYHATESFSTLNESHDVIGMTHAIQSAITIDRVNVRNTRVGTISVDISTFQSDNVHRDRAIRAQWLESSRYPIAEFTPIEIHGLPTSYREGRTIPLEVIGTLQMHGVVRPARLALQVTLHGNTLVGHGTLTIHMAEFGVQPPSLGILKVSDQVQLDLRFTARRVEIEASARRRGSQGSFSPAISPNPGAAPNGAVVSALREAMCGVSLAIGSNMLWTDAASEGNQQVHPRRPAICDHLGAPPVGHQVPGQRTRQLKWLL